MAPLGDRDRVGKVVPSSQGRTSMPGSHITDHQVRFYMLFRQRNALQAAAAKAGFSTANGLPDRGRSSTALHPEEAVGSTPAGSAGGDLRRGDRAAAGAHAGHSRGGAV